MAGVCHLEIQETVSQLHEVLAKQKDIVNYKKVQCLYLMKTGKVGTVKELSELLGVHRVTIQKWFKKYREVGINGLLTTKKSSGRPSVVSERVLSDLKERLSPQKREFETYEQVQRWLEEKYGVDLNYKTLYGLVRYKLNVNLKIQNPERERLQA